MRRRKIDGYTGQRRREWFRISGMEGKRDWQEVLFG